LAHATYDVRLPCPGHAFVQLISMRAALTPPMSRCVYHHLKIVFFNTNFPFFHLILFILGSSSLRYGIAFGDPLFFRSLSQSSRSDPFLPARSSLPKVPLSLQRAFFLSVVPIRFFSAFERRSVVFPLWRPLFVFDHLVMSSLPILPFPRSAFRPACRDRRLRSRAFLRTWTGLKTAHT